MDNQAHALDAGLRLCFIRASFARASDARRSAKPWVRILKTLAGSSTEAATWLRSKRAVAMTVSTHGSGSCTVCGLPITWSETPATLQMRRTCIRISKATQPPSPSSCRCLWPMRLFHFLGRGYRNSTTTGLRRCAAKSGTPNQPLHRMAARRLLGSFGTIRRAAIGELSVSCHAHTTNSKVAGVASPNRCGLLCMGRIPAASNAPKRFGFSPWLHKRRLRGATGGCRSHQSEFTSRFCLPSDDPNKSAGCIPRFYELFWGNTNQWSRFHSMLAGGEVGSFTIPPPTISTSPWRLSFYAYSDFGVAQIVRRFVHGRRMPFEVASAWLEGGK